MAEPVPHVKEMTVSIRVPGTGEELVFVHDEGTHMVSIKCDVRGDRDFILIAEMSRVEFRCWAADLAAWATMLQSI
jgi:hypothetical protein